MRAMKNTMKFKNANKVASFEEGFGWGAGQYIYLKDGWSFTASECENMKGFDTRAEAIKALRDIYPCACKECRDALDGAAVKASRAAELKAAYPFNVTTL